MRFSLAVSIVFAIICIATDFVIYKRLHKHKRLRTTHVVISTAIYLLLISVPVVLSFRHTGTHIMQYAMWALFTCASVFLPKTFYAVFLLLSNIPRLFKRKPVKYMAKAGTIIGYLLFITIWWGALVTTRQIQINEINIESDNLPESFDGYKIVQFSDLHTGTFGDNTAVISNMVTNINALNPDLIVFTGDIVNNSSSELYPFIDELRKMKSKDGVISILGNHDYGDYKKWKTEADKQNNLSNLIAIQRDTLKWQLLLNQHTYIKHDKDSLLILGVENWGEPPFTTHGDLKAAMPKDDYKGFKILLSHNPKHWEMEVNKKTDIDLTLSGHTHAMQMMLSVGSKKYSPSSLRYQHWQGLYKHGKQLLYVNIGMGEVGIPMRIGAKPEITLINLKHTER